MRKNPAANCKGCKGQSEFGCSLGYPIIPNWKGVQCPTDPCPKPTTEKALNREIKKNDQATNSD